MCPQDRKDMLGRASNTLRSSNSGRGILPIAANSVNSAEYATISIDRLGRICNCCSAAAQIFGVSQARLSERPVSEFIPDLFREGSSPSYRVRYLAYLFATHDWRIFQARDAGGRAFVVELRVFRPPEGGEDLHVLELRRLDRTAFP